MKICIVSTGRAGSTSLYNLIKNHLDNDYYTICEPFHEWVKQNKKENELEQIDIISQFPNVLIKTVLDQLPEGKDMTFLKNWILTTFDKVILLDRKDIKTQSESFAFLTHTKTHDWHIKQVYKMSIVPQKEIDFFMERLQNDKKILEELSNKIKKEIYYYEDLYIEKKIETIKSMFEFLGLKLKDDLVNEWIFSDKKRVRMNIKKTMI